MVDRGGLAVTIAAGTIEVGQTKRWMLAWRFDQIEDSSQGDKDKSQEVHSESNHSVSDHENEGEEESEVAGDKVVKLKDTELTGSEVKK